MNFKKKILIGMTISSVIVAPSSFAVNPDGSDMTNNPASNYGSPTSTVSPIATPSGSVRMGTSNTINTAPDINQPRGTGSHVGQGSAGTGAIAGHGQGTGVAGAELGGTVSGGVGSAPTGGSFAGQR